jgi:hypothetical protein
MIAPGSASRASFARCSSETTRTGTAHELAERRSDVALGIEKHQRDFHSARIDGVLGVGGREHARGLDPGFAERSAHFERPVERQDQMHRVVRMRLALRTPTSRGEQRRPERQLVSTGRQARQHRKAHGAAS